MKTSLVVTSISSPNPVLKSLAEGAVAAGCEFIVIGDTKSPRSFELEGARFYGIEEQRSLDLSFARVCPERHYSRKNIGYLLALKAGCDVIIETDDDNFPREQFWSARARRQDASPLIDKGWVNAYRYFTPHNIWPRGLPLDEIRTAVPARPPVQSVDCPIQQGLADENPDVDAIFRLVLPLPVSFEKAEGIALGNGSWCPFNSQNTTWFREAAPLMYLPSHCSFRMTDIWRSFVAQRIAWANGWSLLFHNATVYQERNEHNLMHDFADEVVGYLRNKDIAEALSKTELAGGSNNLCVDLRRCYEALIGIEVIDRKELGLLDAWVGDLEQIG